jgi:acyl-CoA reductase-like NAD-dependent aldehyde dehydrogenase
MDTSTDTPSAELQPTLARLRAAWQGKRPDYRQRRDDLQRLREALKRRLPEMADTIAADFGQRSRHETLLADGMTVLNEIDHLRSHLRRWMKPKRVGVGWRFWPARAEIRPEPVGVVGVIAPWNYPVNLALIPLATAIAAGNHVYLKPSEHTPNTTSFLRSLLAEVFPADRVAVAAGGAEVAGAFAALPFDHLVFTGSTAVGRKVMAAAAPNLTPLTLELGGKSPAIVMGDAEMELAIPGVARGIFANAGQVCVAGSRVYAHRSICEQLTAGLAAEAAKLRLGHGLDPDTDLGPLISPSQAERVAAYVAEGQAEGAEVVTGGRRERAFYEPTVVTRVKAGMRMMREEIFGPVVAVTPFDDEEEALAFANDSPYGLAASVWTRDLSAAHRTAARIRAGTVWINCHSYFSPELPKGGHKQSGWGYENGAPGLENYLETKTVCALI